MEFQTAARPWHKVTPDECEALLRLYEAGQLTEDVRQRYAINASLVTLQRNLRRYRENRRFFRQDMALTVQMPPSPSKRYMDYEVVEADDCILISDVEIPDHNPLYLEYALLLGMTHGIRTLIIAGDLVATDQQTLNEWARLWRVEDLSYEDTIHLTRDILRRFAAWFTQIIVIEGNHDDRVARKTGGEVHLGMFISGERVRYSRYAYLWIKNSAGKYAYVCHPRQYSANSVGLGQRLYNTLVAPDGSKPTMVWVAHTHQAQSGMSADGLCEIHALGTCREKERTGYKAVSASTHFEWVNAIGMIRRTYGYNLNQRADWRFWLGDYYPGTKETTDVDSPSCGPARAQSVCDTAERGG